MLGFKSNKFQPHWSSFAHPKPMFKSNCLEDSLQPDFTRFGDYID